ncbi:hypothetical protein LEP1GSC109_1901 [Leptospira interrogans str. UI 13372]|uniref:Uncharacterized protein n=1 Tax=Leptospira interrogans str. 2006001854 TaxID=1001590 RepID=M6GAH7_LEPIR|nr:hypothetical protein LEP1GSC037_5294 [Leptospira interrogans str. 2006001854]EMN69034.1 hypothetical protein LEP1GSC098_1043 [Leptospira interrogans serovar Grippotyphosa str. UI 08434]EMO94279.1 hypothetical protein LEP1GSC109_1901 [Leptospira interrogans str. UI 13372]
MYFGNDGFFFAFWTKMFDGNVFLVAPSYLVFKNKMKF